ncbi:MAG: M48 family metallopeptidase [Nevskia sp.]|nr:M48 family metallopeptidase [Nevskia sp.]
MSASAASVMPLQGPLEPLRVVERHSRQARSIRIEVRPDGEVRLVIPRNASRRQAYEFLRAREDWVRRKLAELHRRSASAPTRPPLRWDGSDTLPVHGVEVPLHVVGARLARPRVRFAEEAVTLFCSAAARAHPATLAAALRAALRERARMEAQRLLDREAARLAVDYRGPRIADQKSLWGSCTPKGVISLNWRLVLAPPEVFRYVVIHELCHRRHLDHSRRFWSLVAQQMPDYGVWRTWLRQRGAELHEVLPHSRRAGNGIAGDAR